SIAQAQHRPSIASPKPCDLPASVPHSSQCEHASESPMSIPASTAQNAHALGDLSGTIVLVGAGKMGGAMLEGWLALGLAPQSVVVVEPQPAQEITAMTARGLRLNPPPREVAKAAAIVLAIKPQVAPD